MPIRSQAMHIFGKVMPIGKGMRTTYHQVCRSCCSATAPCAWNARAVAEFSVQEKLCTGFLESYAHPEQSYAHFGGSYAQVLCETQG